MFYHLITKFVFNKYLWEVKQSALSHKSDKEKSVVSFMHEQNIICSQTQLDDIGHEQTIEKEQKFALNDIHVWYIYATTALSLRINSCLQGRVDLILDKQM